jgi:hypothetical protein
MKTTHPTPLYRLALLALALILLAACVPAAPVAEDPTATLEIMIPAPTQPATEAAPEATEVTEVTAAPLDPSLPATCQVAGMSTYVEANGEYCFAYPAEYEVALLDNGVSLRGPALTSDIEPVRIDAAVWARSLSSEANLTRIVDDYLSQRGFTGLPFTITRTPVSLGGEPAELIAPVPGRPNARVMMALHNQRLYTLSVSPAELEPADALDLLYNTLMASFTFMGGQGPVSAPPLLGQWVDFDHAFELRAPASLAIWLDPWAQPKQLMDPGIMFTDAHPAYAEFRLLGYNGGQAYQLPYPFAHPQVIFMNLAEFTEFPMDSETGFSKGLAQLMQVVSGGTDLEQACALTRLQNPTLAGNLLPFLPWTNEAQVLCAQPEIIRFNGGIGVRYLTTFSQGFNPLLDGRIFYTFQGLSDDSAIYVSAVLPVNSGLFPTTPPENFPDCINPDSAEQCRQRFAEGLAALQSHPADGFSPTLMELDALISGITIRQ